MLMMPATWAPSAFEGTADDHDSACSQIFVAGGAAAAHDAGSLVLEGSTADAHESRHCAHCCLNVGLGVSSVQVLRMCSKASCCQPQPKIPSCLELCFKDSES